jgi:hypothetical protein
VQSVFGRRVLEKMAVAVGAAAGTAAVRSDAFEARFKHVWADNADAMSLRYTGVGALKTDFTRSGKRSGKGMAQDAIKSVKRLAQHKFHDGGKQHFLDLLLGVEVSAERRSAERGSPTSFYASVAGAGPQGVEAAAWVAAVGVALAAVEVGPVQLVVHLPARRSERRFARDCVLAALPLPDRPTGARIVWRDQPEPLKLYFLSRAVRDRFVALLAPPLLLPELATAETVLPLMLVSWRGLHLQPSDSCVPGTAASVASRLFGALHPGRALVVVLALQEIAAAPLPLHDPFIDSGGMTADSYVVTLFQLVREL